MNINIEAIIASKSNNIQTKLSAGYKLGGKETLTLTEAKAAIKKIVEAVILRCSKEAKNKDIEVPACDDHTPYWGACVSCGRYDNPNVIIGSEIDKQSILNVKTQIDYE